MRNEEREVETAKACLAEALDALEDGRYLDAIEQLGSATHFTGEAATRERPVATVRIERAGDHQDTWTDIRPGQTKEIDVHGRATVRVQGEALTGGDDTPHPGAGGGSQDE